MLTDDNGNSENNLRKNTSPHLPGPPTDLFVGSRLDDEGKESQLFEKSFEPFGMFAENGRLPKFFQCPADTDSDTNSDLGVDSDVTQSPNNINGVLYGRFKRYSTYKRHWIHIPRALALLQDELHFFFNCSVKFPLYWADDILVNSDWRKHSMAPSEF
jgi:hypothetical protein